MNRLNLDPKVVCGAVIALSMSGLLLVGCSKQGGTGSTVPVAAAKSAVEVKSSGESLIVRTPSAEFTLSSSGTLSAALIKDGAKFTLDGKSPAVGQIISLSKKNYPALVLDTGKAEVSDAASKLGNLGKQINVTGKIPGTELEETLTLEVYDAFPNLALLSVRLRNAGTTDVPLDGVTLQRHSLEADDNPANPSHALWTFEGASLKWGKDEIFAMPAKFPRGILLARPSL